MTILTIFCFISPMAYLLGRGKSGDIDTAIVWALGWGIGIGLLLSKLF